MTHGREDEAKRLPFTSNSGIMILFLDELLLEGQKNESSTK
jgi:hypothetical protein